jgi:acyl-CoA thioesterase FadM
LLDLLGISAQWVRSERIGLFDLEHHIWYQNEVHVGEEVGLYLRFTARNLKRAQGVVFLLNQTRDRLASVVEFVSIAAHLDTRRSMPLPGGVAQRLDDLIRQQQALDWSAPSSGAISI